ncbi:hypothetical protein BDN70DRAFT_872325 [Pholiota conissans]|uniref:F-box domain-containing protein n=1 Tax=Pholiota conissans TaxID=109636 RepID=A0A9P5ZAP0_9AGAR|nr:hypothetical protein BDN70DRAFT_872325 [Pholiota conissans]
MKPTSASLDTPCITHPLNTPYSSQESASHYFAAYPARGEPLNVHPYPTILAGSLFDLPNEILAYILELGYFECDGNGAPDTAFRTLASRISSRLRQVVLRTPSLWSIIHVSPNSVPSQMDPCIRHSMKYPLDIRLRCFWEPEMAEEIMEKLVPHQDRWRRLSMTVKDDFVLTLLGSRGAPLLEYLDISYHGYHRHIAMPSYVFGGQLPRLDHLCLRHVDITNLGFSLRGIRTLEIRGYGTWPAYPQLKELLGGSESLENLVLHVKPGQVLEQVFPDEAWDAPHPQIYLPELRTMNIYTSEWLSSKMTPFIRLFAFPKLDSLALYEDATQNLDSKPQAAILYTRGTVPSIDQYLSTPQRLPNRLDLVTCSLYLGCLAMSGIPVTTLELRGVRWPDHAMLKTVFDSLGALENLFIYDLNPKQAIRGLLRDEANERLSLANYAEMEDTITLPRLQCLVVEFTERSTWDVTRSSTFAFLRVFIFPALHSLRIAKIIGLPQWKAIVDAFTIHASEYHSLTSLTLAKMSDLLPTNPHDPHYTDIATAFPYIRDLSLDSFASSNSLLLQLLRSASTTALSGLKSLSLRGDPNVSKPLLHRVISARERAGAPLMRLCLDRHFASNAESLAWIKEHVEVVEVDGEPCAVGAPYVS